MEQHFYLEDPTSFKLKALYWADRFDTVCLLDSNNYSIDSYTAFDVLLAAGVKHEIKAYAGDALEQLELFLETHRGKFALGHLTYDLKNEIEPLHSRNTDHLAFPDLYFFIPEYLLKINGPNIIIDAENPDLVWKAIDEVILPTVFKTGFSGNLMARLSYENYREAIIRIKQHILRGDIYEINYCQEFFAKQATIHPINTFIALNELSPTPFANFFKHEQRYILSATPERFLSKRANKLISQPIKGTAKRNTDAAEDLLLKTQLRNNLKEITENVMIVDLVRNDLTKSAHPGTVQVEELFGIYSFPQVHQMISTVVCQVADHLSTTSIIRNTFPMGSMTGAPKLKSMQLIEKYEYSKRGIYSGSVGYFSPEGDFDFNVIIRTILYNAKNNYLSFHVGSAITVDADPRQEYEECLLKAQAIMQILSVKDANPFQDVKEYQKSVLAQTL